jgi:hypothetical protein
MILAGCSPAARQLLGSSSAGGQEVESEKDTSGGWLVVAGWWLVLATVDHGGSPGLERCGLLSVSVRPLLGAASFVLLANGEGDVALKP